MLGALALLAAVATPGAAPIAWAETTEQPGQVIERGRRIYEAGQLGSGEPLRAQRGEQGMVVSGRAAACINCHQRSGFGLFEAANLVPPVTGPSLFSNAQPRNQAPRRAKGVEHQEFSFLTRPPYDELSLARALSGIAIGEVEEVARHAGPRGHGFSVRGRRSHRSGTSRRSPIADRARAAGPRQPTAART